VLVNDALYVHGGKVDQSNQYSYSSAPNTNQVLFLSLSSEFSAQSPPWTLVSSSPNTSTSLAWHSLSAFNTSHALRFGGLPDPNSETVLLNLADSAAIFDVSTRTSPVWVPEPSSWGGQPIRRHRHSSITSPDGHVFIFGGERSDGSRVAFSDHFYFAGSSMSFNSLPTSNAPPDLYGHASVILSDGRILVFGGYSPSQSTLLPFSTIWVLDSSKMEWSVTRTDTSSLPSPRVAFAAASIPSGRVIIQGGCDSGFQTNFADGWVLDTTTNPWKWSSIDALSQVGPRRDHFAVSFGAQVIFGFGKYSLCHYFLVSDVRTGYLDNGPAPPALEVYSPSSNTFVSTYPRPPPGFTPTQTVPPISSIPSNSKAPSSKPGSSADPLSPTPNPPPIKDKNRHAAAIALGTVFGFFAFLAVGVGAAYYVRKRQQSDGGPHFMALSDEDGDIVGDSHRLARAIPIVKMHNAPSQHGILGSLGVALKMRNSRSTAPRRDMLADEDARSLGEWYNHPKSVVGSTWSLKSILGAGMKTRSRHPSSGGLPSSPSEEKDPFADTENITRDEHTGLISLTARTPTRLSRRETSYQSWRSDSSYHDPFSDPVYDYAGDPNSADLYQGLRLVTPGDETREALERQTSRASVRPPLLNLQSVLPVSRGGHPLSPLSEHTSQSTLPSQRITSSNSSHGHSTNDSPLNTGDSSPSLPPRTVSIINTSNSSLGQPVRRTDSWWSRFSRANTSRKGTYDIRDPNPPPKLGAIEEASSRRSTPAVPDEEATSHLPTTLGPIVYPPRHRTQKSGEPSDEGPSKLIPTRVYGAERYGKSFSSLKTSDSEAIERMAGTMDVVHYMKSRSQSENRRSISGLSIETFSSVSGHEDNDVGTTRGEKGDNLILFAAPSEMLPMSPTFRHPLSADQGDDPTLPHAVDAAQPPTSPGSVAEKVRNFERRMSMEAPVSPTTPNTKHREERTKKRVEVNYGLAPKPSLFVANPDRGGSTDS